MRVCPVCVIYARALKYNFYARHRQTYPLTHADALLFPMLGSFQSQPFTERNCVALAQKKNILKQTIILRQAIVKVLYQQLLYVRKP